MDPRDPVCERLGALAARAAPGESGRADARQWAAIDARLDRHAWRRARLWPAVALSMAAVGLVAFLVVRRPLGYRVQGCAEISDGASCAGAQGTVSFSDGTQVALDAQTRIHIEPLRFGAGASIALDEGSANLAVVHRAGAHWTVNAGPFRVEVTGTRFRVAWSRAEQAVSVSVTEGEVHVSGGSLGQTAVLRAGQSLHAGLAAEPNRGLQAPSADSGASGAVAAISKTAPAPVAVSARSAGRRTDAAPRPSSARSQPERARVSEAEPGRGPQRSSSLAWFEPRLDDASTRLGGEIGTESERPITPRPSAVSFAPDGTLSGAMTGMTWLARGDGTRLSAPMVHERFVQLRAQSEGLCTSGTVAGLRCVNEDTPKARCNWDTNWGVSIGFRVRDDEQAWGDGAPKRIAIDFHGRQARYRLNVHRKGDPHEKNYCIEAYRSGQAVTPSMFKTRCWEDAGESLADFALVDSFNLQFSSGMEYVAFHYCISAIRVVP